MENNKQKRSYHSKDKKILEIDDEINFSTMKNTISIENDMDFTPQKKKNHLFSKKNILKYSGVLTIFVIFIFGLSYAFFTYYSESSQTASITTAEAYVKILENKVTLTVPVMYPMTREEAQERNDNYVDFTLKGKNTSTNKKLVYNLIVQDGDAINGKNRIAPAYVKLELGEYINNEYVPIISNISLSTFSYNGFVLPETNSEITRLFRLRVWIGDEVSISDTDPEAIYTQSEFANLFATVSVSVDSSDTQFEFAYKLVQEAINAKINAVTNSCNPVWVDDMGTANDESDDITYFSGTNDCVDMNYVWYSGKLWRITAIYPDGAMKLITENNITTIVFNANDQVNFYTDENTTSYMYQWLNEDFYDTLYHASEFIDTTKKWNATNSNESAISTRLPETTLVDANVGLLNSYEYYNSYRCIGSSACTGSTYSTGYLNIKYQWWLLNPYNASNVWNVSSTGNGNNNKPTNTNGGRPSIYLKSGLEFTGDGSKLSPYKIIGDKDKGSTNDLINTRLSGEYVKLVNNENEQVFRIIGVEDNKTKIIAMDYADNKGTRRFATNIGAANTLWGSGATTDTDTWYEYLNRVDNSDISNTGYYDKLVKTYGELFTSGIYYLGTSGINYKLSVCANTTSGNTKVCDKTSQVGTFNIGLPRYGEMFATQQGTGYSNSIQMWLINRYSTLSVWYVLNYCNGNYYTPTAAFGGRPTVHLKSTVKILSGSGTESDPYVVGL